MMLRNSSAADGPWTVVDGVPDFWTQVRAAPHRLLGLDYDGTLAPFHVIREAAVPVPGVKETLLAIRDETDTTVILLTGRPAKQVQALLGAEVKIPIIGSHGSEVLNADGSVRLLPPEMRQQDGLRRAWKSAVEAGYGSRLEKKLASIALHTREAPDAAEIETTVEERWWPLTFDHNLEILRFNGGIELRARGRNKGIAFAAHFAAMPSGTLPVYLGDDATDEDVFQTIRLRGIGIKVGDGISPTAAAGRLSGPPAVLDLLKNWRRALAPSDTST
ncbi:MAG TPA: trehalose-phosphatase [bacterium]|jgi:trehalose-phosphatase